MRSKNRFFLFNILLLPIICTVIFQFHFAVPNSLTLFEGEEYQSSISSLLYADPDFINASANNDGQINKTYKVPLKLFGLFTVKTVSVSVEPKVSVIPMGNAVGIRMHSEGPMVVGFEAFQTESGKFDISGSADIKTGDRIISIDNELCENTKTIINKMAKHGGDPLILGIMRNGKFLNVEITPKFDVNARIYRLGIWLRDSTAGIGTLTFVIPKTLKFAALGHGITDIDTGSIVDVSDGKIVTANIFDLKKGKSGDPGELRGSIPSDKSRLGAVLKNSVCGVFGTMDKTEELDKRQPIPAASRSQVRTGKATILCCIEGSRVEEFEIEIVKTDPTNIWGAKGMVIKVTDPRLLEKTGGIVQGMSGSPIIQSGRLAGAVTHVFISDPTKGYGIYIEDMLDELRRIS